MIYCVLSFLFNSMLPTRLLQHLTDLGLLFLVLDRVRTSAGEHRLVDLFERLSLLDLIFLDPLVVKDL